MYNRPILAAVVGILFTGSASAASLLVDDYSTNLEATTTAASPTTNTASDAGVGAIGDRLFSVEKVVGNAGLSAATSSINGTGLSLSSAGSVDAIHRTKYGAVVDLNLDLSIYNSLLFHVQFLDLAPVTFQASLTDGGGTTEMETISLDATTTAPGYSQSFSLSNFDLVNLMDIDMIEFTFDGLAGADLIIESASFEVPVPAALPLLVGALGGLAALRRRKKA